MASHYYFDDCKGDNKKLMKNEAHFGENRNFVKKKTFLPTFSI